MQLTEFEREACISTANDIFIYNFEFIIFFCDGVLLGVNLCVVYWSKQQCNIWGDMGRNKGDE